MKTATWLRKGLSIFLGLTLLCGVFSGTMLYSAADSSVSVKTFSVDFADLVTAAGEVTYTDDFYKSEADDVAINNWVNERFGMLYNRESRNYGVRNYLGESSLDIEKAYGENWEDPTRLHYWEINKNGYLQHTVTAKGSEMLRKGDALWLKHNGEAAILKNFEAKLVFNFCGGDLGSVYVAFHETGMPGVFGWSGADFIAQDAVILGNGGGNANAREDYTQIKKNGEAPACGSNNILATGDAFPNDKNMVSNTDYELYMKVVGTTLTVKVTKAGTDEVLYSSTTTDKISDKAGSISFGTTNTTRSFKRIEVTELDENGQAVDFGTYMTPEDSFSVDFSKLVAVAKMDNADAFDGVTEYRPLDTDTFIHTNINTWVNARFGMYVSKERNYFAARNYLGESSDALLIAAGHSKDSDGRDSYWNITSDGYLRLQSEGDGMLRKMEALTLKRNGNYMQFNDFEANLTFKFGGLASAYSNVNAVFVSFHETGVPGKIDWEIKSGDNVADNPDLVVVGSGRKDAAGADGTCVNGIRVKKAGDNLQDVYTVAASAKYPDIPVDGLAANVDYNLYIQVIGTTLTLKLTNVSTGAVLYSAVMKDAVSDTAGTLSFGASNYNNVYIKSFNATMLENTATVDESGSIAVNTVEGCELKVGSLLATDANGDTYVPQRVGFRNGGDASQYEVLGGTAPYTLSYEFVQPTLAEPNIGNIGISYNAEKVGLRFISRFTRKVVEGVEYLVLDGTMYAIKDYGMLLTSDAGLKTTVDPSSTQQVETAMVVNSDNLYVKKLSIVEANKYYDVCDDHVDMAVTLINIDSVQGYGDPDLIQFYARPYIIVDVNGVETPLYGEYFHSNNMDVAKEDEKTTNTISALNDADVVLLNGRNALNDDGSMNSWFGNTGFTISGEIAGDVDLTVSYTPAKNTLIGQDGCLLNIIVDGVYQEDIWLNNGENCVTVANDLVNGQHTITVARGMGTSIFGTLQYQSVTYVGTLELPQRSDLQFEFLGDSITDSENIRLAYSALTSKAFGADFTLISQSGNTTAMTTALLNNDTYGVDTVASADKDVVVINLGTNDTGRIGHSSYPDVTEESITADVKNCLTAVREKYPNATIVWVFGMMTTTREYLLQDAVNAWVEETGDTKTSYYSLSAAQNQEGINKHPSDEGHQNAANLLISYLKSLGIGEE